MKRIILALGLALFITSGVTTHADEKLDYQKLVGSWEWGYASGYSTITIERVVTVDEQKVFVRGFYKACPPSCGESKGMPLIGTINLQHDLVEILFVPKNGSRLNLRWNGGERLWGPATLQNWSGDVAFHKK